MANGNVITTKRSRPRLGHSASAKWMRKMQRLGRCRACGQLRPPELKTYCRACQDKVTEYMRQYRNRKKLNVKPVEATNANQGDCKGSVVAASERMRGGNQGS